MKSPLEAPEKQIAEETSAKPEKRAAAAVIDTSKMSKGKREACDQSEASRDPLDERGSFASNLFIGRYDFDRIFPWPEQSAEDREAGKEFLANLEKYLRENVDADEVVNVMPRASKKCTRKESSRSSLRSHSSRQSSASSEAPVSCDRITMRVSSRGSIVAVARMLIAALSVCAPG